MSLKGHSIILKYILYNGERKKERGGRKEKRREREKRKGGRERRKRERERENIYFGILYT